MYRIIFLFVLSSVILSGCKNKTNNFDTTNSNVIDLQDLNQIKTSMENSRKAWNKGDFEGYMEVYLKSDSLVFMGINSITTGWQNTLDRYKKGYPDAASRGILSYQYHSFKPLGEGFILLIGKFILERENKENLQGYFSLIWKKVDNEWKIIVDHT